MNPKYLPFPALRWRSLTPEEKRRYKKVLRKIASGAAVAVALAGLYLSDKHFDPDKVEQIHTSGLTILGDKFGRLEDVLHVDVTGDNRLDSVCIYSKGYAFYSQQDEVAFSGRMYHRIHSGTPEAERLIEAHPVWLRDSE